MGFLHTERTSQSWTTSFPVSGFVSSWKFLFLIPFEQPMGWPYQGRFRCVSGCLETETGALQMSI